jgi:hypothetical protein
MTDYASDNHVVKLVSASSIRNVMLMDHIELGRRQVLAISFVFLNMFLQATNSDNLLRVQRIGYKYASLLWYLSIEGMSLVSKRNMLANVIGMIFLYAREDLKLFRACTEEIIEHLFGWLRQVDKEVTISSMANWVDRMEAFFSAGVRSGLKRGSI